MTAAATLGYPRIVERLLGFGATIDGGNALHGAACNRQLEVCRTLLARGASMEATDGQGRIPLHYFLSVKNSEEIRFVWDYADFGLINRADHAGVTPFMRAAASMDAEGVRHLWENGGRTNLYDEAGMAALHHAAKCGRLETLELLLRSSDLGDYKSVCLNRLASLSDSKKNFASLILSLIHISEPTRPY